MYHLYIKTHNVTGLKYLGQTKCDPYTYLGSGKYWKRHLKKHGTDISTEVLLSTISKIELIETAIFYSNLYDVAKSKAWANIRIEKGDGGFEHINQDQSKYIDLEKQRLNGSKLGKSNKNTVMVIDKNGNKFRVNKDDSRLESGELVGHTKGKIAAYDEQENFYYVLINDIRLKNGELKSNNAGKIYITDGITRRLVKPTSELPDGWYIGDNRDRYNLGKIWINNGNDEEVMVLGAEPLPHGWNKGRLKGKYGRPKLIQQ